MTALEASHVRHDIVGRKEKEGKSDRKGTKDGELMGKKVRK